MRLNSSTIQKKLLKKGTVTLPAGVHLISEPLRLERLHGVTLAGSGVSQYATTDKSGWHGRSAVTRILYDGPADRAAIEMVGCLGVKLENFTIERTTPGVCVAYTTRKGWGSEQNLVERVAVRGPRYQTTGFTFGEKNQPNGHNCATTTIRDCWGMRLDAFVRAYNSQSVQNFVQSCHVFYSNLLYDQVCGGHTTIQNCFVFEVPVIYRTKQGGANVGKVTIRDLGIDGRKAADEGVTLVDATDAVSSVSARIDGIAALERFTANKKGVNPKRALIHRPRGFDENPKLYVDSIDSCFALGHTDYAADLPDRT